MALSSGFRLSMFFSFAGVKSGGWSENYWNSGAFGSGSMVPNCVALVALRQVMTCNQGWISAYRIADVSTSRNVQTFFTNYGPTTQTGIDGDAAQIKLLIALAGNGNYLTRQWIGAMRDSDITQGGKYTPATGFAASLAAFGGALQLNGWCICNQSRAVVPVPITGLTNAGVVTVGANTFTEGQSVRIKNVHGFRAANKVWRITLPTATTFTLVGWIPYVTPPLFYGPKAVAVLQQPILTTITSLTPIRGTKHDVGRPIYQDIGRRKRRSTSAGLAVVGP